MCRTPWIRETEESVSGIKYSGKSYKYTQKEKTEHKRV